MILLSNDEGGKTGRFSSIIRKRCSFFLPPNERTTDKWPFSGARGGCNTRAAGYNWGRCVRAFSVSVAQQ